MSLRAYFESAVDELRKRNVPFAVAGGFAADLYRNEPRLTMDIDLALLVDHSELATARSILKSLGLKTGIARVADLAGGPPHALKKKNTKPCIAIGRPADQPDGEGVDLLLSGFPWIQKAVHRAQHNLIDFGFGAVPCLTIEDVILAKCWAIQTGPLRAKDLDDLQSIYAGGQEVDDAYLAGQFSRFKIKPPKAAIPLLPDELLQLVKDSR
jgi:hypothetical protein